MSGPTPTREVVNLSNGLHCAARLKYWPDMTVLSCSCCDVISTTGTSILLTEQSHNLCSSRIHFLYFFHDNIAVVSLSDLSSHGQSRVRLRSVLSMHGVDSSGGGARTYELFQDKTMKLHEAVNNSQALMLSC